MFSIVKKKNYIIYIKRFLDGGPLPLNCRHGRCDIAMKARHLEGRRWLSLPIALKFLCGLQSFVLFWRVEVTR